MTDIKLLICDWAGTTVDYGCFAPIQALKLAFDKADIPVNDEELRQPMGMGKKDHIRTMLDMPRIQEAWTEAYGKASTESDVETIYANFNAAILETLKAPEYAEPKPGVVEGIEKLRQAGLHIGATTGYTAEMMELVEPAAADQGYAPDYSVTSEAVGQLGRPYPYMIFANMAHFEIESVDQVIKIGDTLTDIKEGQHAGVLSCAVIEGSSEMALSQEEFEALSANEQDQLKEQIRQKLLEAGADQVFDRFEDLVAYLVD
ncbi:MULTISPECIES: phosphonoacetaldehyde hydrolase [Aerococcus]|uniref:phosphonoacetaldehyde hydrolase n=1 Tax=Aerococcus TaxID=1375 RepID=UPI0008A5E2D6|nr:MULTISPECIES: phosphonoacetaldehyde hydrolase [Aerococcus]MDK6369336.1 phosphonoacetaldehyde hydrolase [Aerococcus sp. UMB9870]MDK6679161.1 phosphonoacetaldehyde hydrolase [Aerococcus sp. UMB8608]MDK6687154.1 phosphonoacetaldehyde hydrolase [Aerococcus sp. UMB8623]MDK6940672.1 phosphonoacetaldehyde hydrolase [Aerococcus sp. UMB8487]OFK18439.1 phosphonoacetaldehyde hydrolase [Aerococcus sp. HMSC072A12]